MLRSPWQEQPLIEHSQMSERCERHIESRVPMVHTGLSVVVKTTDYTI
jgi:hypothetical protein